jgi:hypothetical protein
MLDWRGRQPITQTNHYKFDDIGWIGEDANQLANHYKFDDICWIGEDANQLPDSPQVITSGLTLKPRPIPIVTSIIKILSHPLTEVNVS